MEGSTAGTVYRLLHLTFDECSLRLYCFSVFHLLFAVNLPVRFRTQTFITLNIPL